MYLKRCCICVFTVGLVAGVATDSQAQLPENAWDILSLLHREMRTQNSTYWRGTQPQIVGEDCAAGEIYDDGSAENGYSGNPGIISQVDVVQLFNPGSSPLFYVTACVNYTTISAGGTDLDLEIVAFANNGGTPGALIASMPESITGIQNFPTITWFGFDITAMNLNVTEPIFVGVRQNPMSFPSRFVAADESPATTLHTGFVNFYNPDNWQTTQSVFPDFRANLIRLVAGEPVPAVPSSALLAALAGLLLVTVTRLARRQRAA